MKLNAKQIATATGGRFLEESLDTNTFINRCVYNYKKVCKNDLYAAITDANYNGHDYIEPAIYSGAKVVLVERPVKTEILNLASIKCCNIIEVDDIILSLQNIAKYWRQKNHKKSVAIYGLHNIVQNFNHQNILIEQPNFSVFNLSLNLQKNIVKTELNTFANISVPLAIINSEHDTDLIILDGLAPDLQTLRETYKLAWPQCAVVTTKLPDEVLFNVVNNLPDLEGELLVANSVYLEIKDKYLRQAVARGVRVVVFGQIYNIAKEEVHQPLQLPEVYFEADLNRAAQSSDSHISVTVHADGFRDNACSEALNQVTHITLPKNSLDFINEVGGFIALNCMLGISLYDIKEAFKC